MATKPSHDPASMGLLFRRTAFVDSSVEPRPDRVRRLRDKFKTAFRMLDAQVLAGFFAAFKMRVASGIAPESAHAVDERIMQAVIGTLIWPSSVGEDVVLDPDAPREPPDGGFVDRLDYAIQTIEPRYLEGYWIGCHLPDPDKVEAELLSQVLANSVKMYVQTREDLERL